MAARLRAVDNFIENVTRAQFGVRPVGDGSISESLLVELVRQIFPGEEVVRHLRPDWLEGLELDIWLPGIRLAIEYQGEQHFKPITAWGGTDAFFALQERDARKIRLAAEAGIRLVHIDFTEPLTLDLVRERTAS